MSLDKFGRTIALSSKSSSSHLLPPYRHGFTFTIDGNIDVENLKLCNIKDPTEVYDCANKQYVDTVNENLFKKVDTIKQNLLAKCDSTINAIPEVVNKQVNINIQAYKIDLENSIKNLSSDIVALKNELKIVRTNIDTVERKINHEIGNIRIDIPNYTQNFLKEKLTEQRRKTNATIQKTENKLVSGLTNITSRIEALEKQTLIQHPTTP